MIDLSKLDLSEQDRLEVCHVLGSSIPEFEVRAFGSRVTGKAKPYSDLDLAVMTAQPLTLGQLASIKDAFDESEMTIRVDIVDWAAASSSFQAVILKDQVIIQKSDYVLESDPVIPACFWREPSDVCCDLQQNIASNAQLKPGQIRKGNPYARRLLCEFAHAASRTKSVFKSKFQALVVRRGYKRAIVAIAHKIMRTIFFMLKRNEHYRDSATDYEALSVQRNAPRWIKALTKFGFIPSAS